MKSLAQFISLTRGKPCTIRGDEVEIDGHVLCENECRALMDEFDKWTPPPEPEPVDIVAELEALRARTAELEARVAALEPTSR